MWPFKRKQPAPVVEEPTTNENTAERPKRSALSTHPEGEAGKPQWGLADRLDALKALHPANGQRVSLESGEAVAMDAADDERGANNAGEGYRRGQLHQSGALMEWYASQSFMGHQLAAMVAQHWLVQRACAVPARDAVRNGFNVTNIDGDDLDPEVLKEIKRADRRYKLNDQLIEFLTMGRTFGIRIAIFKVDYGSPEKDRAAYVKPFNIDGVKKGSYRGIVQVDAYWCSPEFDTDSATKPDSGSYFEPTWWNINGVRYHRSHLAIYRHGYLADILKPAYQYGGIPVPQLIMERVYGAERTANEAPLLAMTKRTTVYKTNVEKAMTNFSLFAQKINKWSELWSNNGVRVIGETDEINQIDTSLADFPELIGSQYELVAAAAGMPATKLMQTSAVGMNATGEGDESNYHEDLESIQTHDGTPFIERHHLIMIKSDFPQYANDITTVSWEPLDSPTAKEFAETNKIKSETAKNLVDIGAIDGIDERQRVAQDKSGDYAGIQVNKTVMPNPAEIVAQIGAAMQPAAAPAAPAEPAA